MTTAAMLTQSDASQVSKPLPDADTQGDQHVPLGSLFGVLRRRKLLVALVAIAVGVGPLVYISTLPTYYESEASIMVEPRKTAFSDLQASEQSVSDATLTLRTQSDVLKSQATAKRVVERLGLAGLPEVQAFIHARPLRLRVRDWIAAHVGGPQQDPRPLTPGEVQQLAMRWLASRVFVVNDGRSYTISVQTRMPVPALSAEVANEYANQYMDFLRALKLDTVGRAHALLNEQILPLQNRVRQAEEAVERYREDNGLVLNRAADAGEQNQGVTVAGQQLSLINIQLTTAQATLAEKLGHLNQANAARNTGTGYESVPEVVASPLVQHLLEERATLTSRAAALEQRAMGLNPSLAAIRASVADVDRHLAEEVGKIVGSLRNQANAAQAQVDALQRTLSSLHTRLVEQNRAEVKLRQLTSEADAARAVYRDYLARFEQTSFQSALQEPDAAVMSAAEVPFEPAGPARWRLSAMTVLIAVFIGSLVALAVERLRGGLRTTEQMEAETGMFPLGFIPCAPSRNRIRLEARESVYTAAVDHVRSMLHLGREPLRAQAVLVTSAAPREGKTFFAVSLAASAGRQGARALLIDADIRRPRAAQAVARGSNGEDFLLQWGETRVRLRKEVLPGVDLMTVTQGATQPNQCRLAPSDLEVVVKEARPRYDLIIIDTPPVLAMPDAASMVAIVDAAIMVVRWQSTPVVAVKAAIRTLRAYDARLLGGVLTQVKLGALSKTEGSQAYFYRAAPRYFD